MINNVGGRVKGGAGRAARLDVCVPLLSYPPPAPETTPFAPVVVPVAWRRCSPSISAS